MDHFQYGYSVSDLDWRHLSPNLDDYTLEYTLNKPETFWNSKTTNGILFPISTEFLKSKGDDFGQPNDVKSILANGPFLLKSITSKSSVVFEKNDNYWDKKNVHLKEVKLTYYDGSDQDSLARGFSDGAYTVARLFPASSNFATISKKYKDNIYNTPAGSGVAVLGFNIDRQSYKHTAKKSDAEKAATKKAILNKDFRQAITFALDRESYSAQLNSKEFAKPAIRNTYTAPAFVQVNGKDFGDVVADKLTTYGDQWKGINLADGQDGLYNKDKAKAQLEKAKAELQKDGVQFPIHIDVPVAQSSKGFVARMQSLKQTVEDTLGKDNVVLDLQMMDQDEVLNITLNVPSAADADWDLQGLVGWNPDYDDEYAKLLADANSESLDVTKRYEKYATAQAWLSDSALVIPTMSSTGAATVISKVVPFSGPSSQTGNKGSSYFKYVEVQDEPVTKKQYEQAREKWQKEKAESNKKAQQDLEKHVK
jgi:oligopeptide transport system substrate-binding protein